MLFWLYQCAWPRRDSFLKQDGTPGAVLSAVCVGLAKNMQAKIGRRAQLTASRVLKYTIAPIYSKFLYS